MVSLLIFYVSGLILKCITWLGLTVWIPLVGRYVIARNNVHCIQLNTISLSVCEDLCHCIMTANKQVSFLYRATILVPLCHGVLFLDPTNLLKHNSINIHLHYCKLFKLLVEHDFSPHLIILSIKLHVNNYL